MRRLLLQELPLMMQVFPGVKPWELDRFTVDELTALLAHARKLVRAS